MVVEILTESLGYHVELPVRLKQVGVQDVLAEVPVKAFDVGILSRLTRLDVVPASTSFHSAFTTPTTGPMRTASRYSYSEISASIPILAYPMKPCGAGW